MEWVLWKGGRLFKGVCGLKFRIGDNVQGCVVIVILEKELSLWVFWKVVDCGVILGGINLICMMF